MANASIIAAFERMWQHVVALVGTKANAAHNHDDLYYTEAKIDEMVSGLETQVSNHNTSGTAHSDIRTAVNNAQSAANTAQAGVDAIPSWAKAASKPSYTKAEVGLGNVDNVKQYSASNPPPYPVTSVNGKTGAVTVSVPSKVSDLTNDSGFTTNTGTITGVTAGAGMSGGGTSGNVTITNAGVRSITQDSTNGHKLSINTNGTTSTVTIPDADTGATSVEVTGTGNAITAASYDTTTRKLTLTKGATYSNNAGTITAVKVNGTSVATSGEANIPAASTSAYGVTKLSTSTSGTSTVLAATESAVKAAYDRGSAGVTAAATAQTTADAALPKAGGTMTGELVSQNNANYTVKQVRNIFLIADGEEIPAGSNGDICLIYEP